MSRLEFAAYLASGRRILSMASPENRLQAFRQIAREGIRFHTISGLPKPDVIDGLRSIAVEAALADDEIQDALAAAVQNPFVPPPTSGAAAKPEQVGFSAGDRAELIVRRASEIEPQEIRWLWPNRVAIGKVTIIAGEPGLGKSQLTCAIAAVVTTGGRWPCAEGSAPAGSVLILSAEDDAADTIIPRLDAAGAERSRVLIISAVRSEDGKGRRSFNLQADLGRLEAEIRRAGDVRLVTLDPISSYLGKVDSHRNAEVRAVLEPLGEMAGRLGVAVLGVTHLSKSGSGSPNNRFIGSIAFVAAARAAFIVARDRADKDRRLFLPTKNNVGPEGTGLAFRIGVVETTNGILAPVAMWDGAVAITADEALAAEGSEKSTSAPAREAAEEFLRTILAEKPLPVRQIESEAKAAGLSWATVKRAKDALGIKAGKTALDGGWVWELSKE